ncbi:hypothetical protein [Vibrio taketomensis]|uniref:hypothetical protein n=1 Tax=Vibrio taketomensis TaxID=2572923 RepID=UPI001389AD7E|nr:hypothetical protein [Vibrio taketomensis]
MAHWLTPITPPHVTSVHEELSTGLWINLGLIEGSASAQTKIDNVIEAYVTARAQKYSEYWNIRNGQFDGN